MLMHVRARCEALTNKVLREADGLAAQALAAEPSDQDRLQRKAGLAHEPARWLRTTRVELVLSAGQNEVKDIRDVVETKPNPMPAVNPLRMDFHGRYREIVAGYNNEKDGVTIEETFEKTDVLTGDLDFEARRTVRENLTDAERTRFDMIGRDGMAKANRERLKQASRGLYAKVKQTIDGLRDWTRKESSRAEVRVRILDELLVTLPMPPYTTDQAKRLTDDVFGHVWQQSTSAAWSPKF